MNPRHNSLLAALLLVALAAPLQAQAVFRWLPPLEPGGGTYASSISADGTIVIGQSYGDDYYHAVYWRQAGPPQSLGFLDAGNTMATALATSADGSVIVGYVSSHHGSSDTSQTFRWTAQAGMTSLGDAPGGVLDNQAIGISDDGAVIVGQWRGPDTPDLQHDAFIWTQEGGFAELEGLMPQYAHFNRAAAASADGSVVVGKCGYGGPFRWTQAGGMESLYGLDDDGLPFASAVSADGRFIVGSSGYEAFLWREGSGVQWLGLPGDETWSWANDVSDDGRVVVGGAEYEGRHPEAILWTPDRGMRYLHDVLLTDYGLDIPREALLEATGVSADGRTITGNGGALGAWVVTVPEPGVVLVALGVCAVLRRRAHRETTR